MARGKIANVGAILVGILLGFNASAASKRYLVKFKSPSTFYAMSQNMSAMSALNRNSISANANGMKLFNVNATVTSTLNNVQMMVVESSDALAIQALKNNPAIALVEEEFFHPAPQPIATRDAGDLEALRTRRGHTPKPPTNPSASTMDVPWGITAVKAPQAWNTTRGAGARVMVLDTGVDKGHPALASRIEALRNFTEGDENDVTDEVGHGTHVSGTILADGANGGLVGVAPEAKLLMGKVCTEQGCSNISIASGIDWGTQEKVDVISMSLGGAMLSAAEGQALQAAEKAGVMVVAASGNDGKPTVSFPAASPTCFAVGAIDINLKKADFSNWGPELAIVAPGVDVVSSVPQGTGRGSEIQIDLDGKGLNSIKSLPMVGSPVASTAQNTLVFAGLGKPDDFSGINVKGKFALIARGDIPFKDKVDNAIGAGAAGVLIYNNAAGLMQGTVTTDGSEVSVPVVLIEQSVGESAKALLASGKSVNASVAVTRTDYASYQGTSMATPHVSGVVALVRAANKSLTPAQVRDLLKKTATPLTPNDDNQLGSGLVNAEAAVKQAVTFAPVLQIAN